MPNEIRAPRVLDFDDPGPCEAERGDAPCGAPGVGWSLRGDVFCRDHFDRYAALAARLSAATALPTPTPAAPGEAG